MASERLWAWVREGAIALVVFVVFDIIGVVLTVIADFTGLLHRTLETSAPLGYAIWFVVAVFTSVTLYVRDPARSRAEGVRALVAASVVATLIGLASSLVWGWTGEPVAPDHPGITITWLATSVFAAVVWHVVMLSESRPRTKNATGTPTAAPALVTAAPASATKPVRRPRSGEQDTEFRRAGVFAAIGWIVGMTMLVFLDACFFVLAPFGGALRPLTDPILTAAVVLGPLWGVAAALWPIPRGAILPLHAPALIGSLFWLFAIISGGVVSGMFGITDEIDAGLKAAATVAFACGALLGLAATFGWYLELREGRSKARADGAVTAR
ncbi:hypothetical protein AB0C02_18880 [Micromonospora sp. NPDC048999]|uniref:hypothetical protein n=1 Tax=Micromonospora sp. NPDC048999 TaxID=3155391 RepID=UPI0033EE5586